MQIADHVVARLLLPLLAGVRADSGRDAVPGGPELHPPRPASSQRSGG